MTTDLHTHLQDDSVPLQQRVAMVDQLLSVCDPVRGDVSAITAARAQHGIDSSTRDALVYALQRPESELRWVALAALQCCFPDDDTLRAVFISQMQDDTDTDIRQFAVRALLENFTDDVIAQQAVAELFRHPEAEMRATAIYRLGKTHTAFAVKVIHEWLPDTSETNYHDRYWLLRAVNTLSAHHDMSDLRPLVLGYAQRLPRHQTVLELGEEAQAHIHGIAYQTLIYLTQYGKANDLQDAIEIAKRYAAPLLNSVIAQAEERMYELDAAATEDVIATLLNQQHPDAVRVRLLERLSRNDEVGVHTPALQDALLHLLDGEDNHLRPLAAMALARGFYAEEGLQSRFVNMMLSAEHSIRQAGLYAVQHWEPDDPAVLRAYADLLASTDQDAVSDALHALQDTPTPTAAALLLLALEAGGYSSEELALLLSAINNLGAYIHMGDALETLSQLVYSLPLRPTPAKHAAIDISFAALLRFLQRYADTQSVEIFTQYIAQFKGPRTEQALLDAWAIIHNPAARRPQPTTRPATLSGIRVDRSGSAETATGALRPRQMPTSAPPFSAPSTPAVRFSTGRLDEISAILQFIEQSLVTDNIAAVPEICKHVAHPSRSVKIAAIRALGTFGDERARPALEQATHDENAAIRKLAAAALAKLT